MDEGARAHKRCALPDFDESKWGPTRPGPHMGRLPLYREDRCGESSEDGCPGSWYRTEYISSLSPYMRLSGKDGTYSANIILDRCHDPRVIRAINYYEQERARCSYHLEERRLG